MKICRYILPMLCLLALASCKQEDDVVSSAIKLNLSLAIPVETEVGSRTLGDPGVDEEYLKPTVLWIFLVADQEYFAQRVFLVRYTTDESAWTRSSDNKTFYFSDNRILNFEGLDLSKSPDIRAYLVASHDAFAFNETLVPPASDNSVALQSIDENQLTHLKMYAKYGDNYISLRDVYSTPYNLTTDWGDMNKTSGTYYGTVNKRYFEAGIISVSDTLYHVAAKADFQWNPETSSSQPNVAKGIVLTNLPTEGYVFRPTENTSSVTTYTKLLLGATTADDTTTAKEANAGNQWSGRAYGYMFQPGANKLNYTFTTKNNEAAGGYKGVADPSKVTNSANAGVFASWYKIDHTIK